MKTFKKISAKKTNKFARFAFVAAVAGAAFSTSNPASAGPKLFAYYNSSITFNGTTETDGGNVDPFTVQLFSTGNECLRIAVTAQGADMEATLVAPDGRSWRDDDGNGGLRPLVKAITTTRGWHILRISHYAGSSVHADFTVQVSRLPSTSISCSAPTTPVNLLAPAAAKAPVPMAIQPGGTR